MNVVHHDRTAVAVMNADEWTAVYVALHRLASKTKDEIDYECRKTGNSMLWHHWRTAQALVLDLKRSA